MKQTVTLAGILLAFALSLASCGGNSTDKARIAELEKQLLELKGEQKQDVEAPKSDNEITSQTSSSHLSSSHRREGSRQFVGTYKVVDEYNTTWILTLNRDETMTINEEGSSEVKYGSWSDSPYDVPCFSFSYRDYPYLEFPSGRENIDYGIISDGYLYSSNTHYKAKNPKFRLPITKIK